MDERKQRILRAIIEDYVKSAEPVGSRTIAKNYDLGISPATVRNEMSDLEELGYLEQPHTRLDVFLQLRAIAYMLILC